MAPMGPSVLESFHPKPQKQQETEKNRKHFPCFRIKFSVDSWQDYQKPRHPTSQRSTDSMITKCFFLFVYSQRSISLTHKTFRRTYRKKIIKNWFPFPFFQHLEVVSPFQLYFNPTLILRQYQLWRLATTFLFFGTIGFSFLFNMIFTYRYCRMLEEGSFRGRSSDFVMMFVFGGALMIVSFFFPFRSSVVVG